MELRPAEILIVLLPFGDAKLPQLARSLGLAQHEFARAQRGKPSTQPKHEDGPA